MRISLGSISVFHGFCRVFNTFKKRTPVITADNEMGEEGSPAANTAAQNANDRRSSMPTSNGRAVSSQPRQGTVLPGGQRSSPIVEEDVSFNFRYERH
jgi:hypothetical protein